MNLEERNPGGTPAARISATFDFSREDAVDDQAFNRVIWAAVRGENSPMPPPVRAAFVFQHQGEKDDEGQGDGDDGALLQGLALLQFEPLAGGPGTGSKPPRLHGWHRRSRASPIALPRATP